MLGAAFVVGHVLRRRKFYYVHEASVALILGFIAGAVATVLNKEESFSKYLNFKEDFFILFLLPPIIYWSGFSLQPKPFFSNFGAICIFAIAGTFVASIVTGILIYLAGLFFLVYRLTFLESMIFGSLISATDPVTVLAIFQELGADSNLYALVFGESVLNDAVAIVLYRTLVSAYKSQLDQTLMGAVWFFVENFVGSLGIGVSVALSCALLFKYAGLSVYNLQNLEACLIVLFPYIAYMLAESFGLTGIVAILFCGILMKHYTYPNLSGAAQVLAAGFFQLVASLAETFVFIYMGVSIVSEELSWSHVGFILFSIVSMGLARYANVYPCTVVINYLRPPSKQIPENHKKALVFSGLRGAMAFSLALNAKSDLTKPGDKGETGLVIVTSTTAIVVVTVLVIGGSIATLLERLELVGTSESLEEATSRDEMQHLKSPALDSETDEDDGTMDPLRTRLKKFQQSATFSELDKKYIRPFFTGQSEVSDQQLEVRLNGGNVKADHPSPGRGLKRGPRRSLQPDEQLSRQGSYVSPSEDSPPSSPKVQPSLPPPPLPPLALRPPG
eukprot:SM000058S18532  [mRNA]  locus=s58:444402:450596:+ [translate_table: standard]